VHKNTGRGALSALSYSVYPSICTIVEGERGIRRAEMGGDVAALYSHPDLQRMDELDGGFIRP
jgi:hypothetical protein